MKKFTLTVEAKKHQSREWKNLSLGLKNLGLKPNFSIMYENSYTEKFSINIPDGAETANLHEIIKAKCQMIKLKTIWESENQRFEYGEIRLL